MWNLLLLSWIFQVASGSGVLEFAFSNYSNPGGYLSTGQCCDRNATSCAGDMCHAILRICVKPYDMLTSNDQSCPYGLLRNADFQDALTGGGLQSQELRFTWNWVGNFSASVKLLHYDVDNAQSEVIAVDAFQTALDPIHASQTFRRRVWNVSQDRQILLSYSVKVSCDANYYGQDCAVFCRPGGHFTCDPASGKKICQRGWRGGNCHVPICRAGCRNGRCVRPFECECDFGWQGSVCSECVPIQGCMHGYCDKPHECKCYERWGGILCDKDQDACYHRQPCRNQARCEPVAPNDYLCVCAEGFSGKQCETMVHLCQSNPCQNHGTCRETENDYICICGPMHTGRHCESLIATEKFAPCFDKENNFFHPHGTRMDTLDCRTCVCMDGYMNCTEATCTPDNCLQPYMNHPRAGCPAHQICQPIMNGECVTGNCSFPFGQCKPWVLAESANQYAGQDCADSEIGQPGGPGGRGLYSGQSCDHFFIHVETAALPRGITVEHICFHLLLFLLSKNMDQFLVQCRSIIQSPLVIKAVMRSVNSRWPINGLRDTLMETLRQNMTASPLLHAVRHVMADIAPPGQHTTTHQPITGSISSWTVEYTCVTVAIVACLICISVLCWLYRRYRYSPEPKMATATDQPISVLANNLRLQANQSALSVDTLYDKSLVDVEKTVPIAEKVCNFFRLQPNSSLESSPSLQKSKLELKNSTESVGSSAIVDMEATV